jgi:hypothetical protein
MKNSKRCIQTNLRTNDFEPRKQAFTLTNEVNAQINFPGTWPRQGKAGAIACLAPNSSRM